MKELWLVWFDTLQANDKRAILLLAVKRLMEIGEIQFRMDDLINIDGTEIGPDEVVDECLYWVSSGQDVLMPIEPLWVPPKGVFLKGWITRDEGDTDFWWHQKDPDYETDVDVEWENYGSSIHLAGIHPDSLPPLTIPAHLSKFRIGDE
jgi:hypothetical protein